MINCMVTLSWMENYGFYCPSAVYNDHILYLSIIAQESCDTKSLVHELYQNTQFRLSFHDCRLSNYGHSVQRYLVYLN